LEFGSRSFAWSGRAPKRGSSWRSCSSQLAAAHSATVLKLTPRNPEDADQLDHAAAHFEQAAAGLSDAALRRALAEERDEAGLSLGPTGLAILRYEQERRDERRREHGD
jgi:hypothetical protein